MRSAARHRARRRVCVHTIRHGGHRRQTSVEAGRRVGLGDAVAAVGGRGRFFDAAGVRVPAMRAAATSAALNTFRRSRLQSLQTVATAAQPAGGSPAASGMPGTSFWPNTHFLPGGFRAA